MKTFHQLLGVTLIAVTTTYFVWFALTFWAYLTTNEERAMKKLGFLG